MFCIFFKVGVPLPRKNRQASSLQQMVTALKTKILNSFAIQSVFEGKNQNTFEKLLETQKRSIS